MVMRQIWEIEKKDMGETGVKNPRLFDTLIWPVLRYGIDI